MSRPELAVYGLTPKGLELARRLGGELGASLHGPRRLAPAFGAEPFDRLVDCVAELFRARRGHVFFCAAGVVVRAIAPLVVQGSKATDPGVVVCDQQGRFAVSLLSGHLGGGNDLARRVARILGGEAVVTTATDSAGLPSLDVVARDQGLAVPDLARVKTVSAALLAGARVPVFDPGDRLGLRASGQGGLFRFVDSLAALPDRGPAVAVTEMRTIPGEALALRPRCLTAGIGCRRGIAAREVLDALEEALAAHGLAAESVAALGTILAKQDEAGLAEAAQRLGLALAFFSAEELARAPGPNPSAAVRKRMGVDGVCEPAALLLARGGPLLVEKTKRLGVTVAVARIAEE